MLHVTAPWTSHISGNRLVIAPSAAEGNFGIEVRVGQPVLLQAAD